MRFGSKFLAGPVLWAFLFAAVYALHGAGCAWDWPNVNTPVGSLHKTAMVALWLSGLLLHVYIVASAPTGPTRAQRLCRMGAWIGLVASLMTLAPILFVSSCGEHLQASSMPINPTSDKAAAL